MTKDYFLVFRSTDDRQQWADWYDDTQGKRLFLVAGTQFESWPLGNWPRSLSCWLDGTSMWANLHTQPALRSQVRLTV